MKYKVDFHTHSTGSPDGALSEAHYRRALERHCLDAIAVTDHNTTDTAKQLQASLGEQIIVGEEIMTSDGEIIGLYLQETVPAFLSARETADRIHKQGGLVYVPHPFETIRKGISLETLNDIAEQVDIIETHNGRAIFQNRTKQAVSWSAKHRVAEAAGSDAHGAAGWYRTYTMVDEKPTRENIVRLLRSASYQVGFPGMRGLAYPKFNRLRRWRRVA